MKKILLAVAIFAVTAMAACGGKESAAVKENESALKTKIENCTNPDSLSLYVDQAKAYAQKLVQEGKVDEAKKYLDQITPVIKDKAPALASTLETVKNTLDKMPAAVADSAASAADRAKQAGEAAVDSAKSAAAATVDAARQKASDAAASTVDAAKQKASDAAAKASDAIQGALGK